MNSIIKVLLGSFILAACGSVDPQSWQEKCKNPDYLHRSVKQITEVMVHDIYSPPVASRTYAYLSIAAYEAGRHDSSVYKSLAGQLKGMNEMPQPKRDRQYCFSLSSVHAALHVGKTLVASKAKVQAFESKLMQEFLDNGMPEDVYQNSLEYGKQIADSVLAWAAKDNYKQTRSFPKYSVSDSPGSWKPTPPAYLKAVEPEWNKIRPFLIDSAQQFKPLQPTPFSVHKNSLFYREALEVYEIKSKLSEEQIQIADFWDCNPFRMNVNGHVMFATKKISPGGHWINIARLACKKANFDFLRSAETYARLSVTMADCFISCWDEKYRSKVIRPETYINEHIDPQWEPILQTPPFPEYTSGHSVLSAGAAEVLSGLFGENFEYSDSTEVEFGIPVRYFKSFRHAADEAAISRLYGGIHYRPAIVNGFVVGTDIGSFVNRKLKTREEDLQNMAIITK